MWVALFSGYISRYMNVHKLNDLAQSFYVKRFVHLYNSFSCIYRRHIKIYTSANLGRL
jgi:hypothetical protein